MSGDLGTWITYLAVGVMWKVDVFFFLRMSGTHFFMRTLYLLDFFGCWATFLATFLRNCSQNSFCAFFLRKSKLLTGKFVGNAMSLSNDFSRTNSLVITR